MKRLFALVLILLFPSICLSDIGSFNPLPTYATNRPPLKRISKSSIASIVRVKNGRGNALHTVVALASDASPSVNIASGLLSIPLYAYSPVVGAAGQYVLGYGLQALVDIAGKYNDGTLQGNSDLNDLIQDELGPSSSEPITGDVLNPGDLGTTSTACNSQVSLGRLFEIIGPAVHYSGVSRQSSDVICVTNYITYIHSCGYSGNPNLCLADEWPGNWVTGKDSTFPRSLPQYLTPELAEQLAQRISDEITANNQTIKDAIKDLIRDNPDLAPDPQQITNQDIANHTNQEIYDNRQENIDY